MRDVVLIGGHEFESPASPAVESKPEASRFRWRIVDSKCRNVIEVAPNHAVEPESRSGASRYGLNNDAGGSR